MTTYHPPVLAQERYLRAASSMRITIDTDRASDADVLLAAAYASAGDPYKSLALRVYRVRATGSMAGARALSEGLAGSLHSQLVRSRHGAGQGGRYLRCTGAAAPSIRELRDMAMRVLVWMHSPACPVCQGRGHPLMPGAPVLDTRRRCTQCKGTGAVAVERVVRSEHAEAARLLADKMDAMCAVVFSDMAKMLAERMSIFGQRAD